MIDTYNFYCSREHFETIINKIQNYLSTELDFKVTLKNSSEKRMLYCKNKECEGVIRFEELAPEKDVEYYQHGINRFVANWDGYVINDSSKKITDYLDTLSKIFSPQEVEKLWEYTPFLKDLISPELIEKQVLKDCIVIFREHSLISVFNVFRVLEEMGLDPIGTAYYSKGDRCKNIYRIEESLKEKGYDVNVLSPFESVSKTGKTEDEKILPEAAARVRSELEPYFKKAKKENKKIIIFDDGGLLITTVIDLFSDEYGDHIVGYIETTKGGMYAINSRKDLKDTILNLAGCEIKELMSSVIGHSIVHRLREMIPHVGLQNRNAIVVGYGSLGRTIASDLRHQGMSVYICDIDDTRAYEALADGYPVSKDVKHLINTYKPVLIMGCTGMDALTYENLSSITTDTYVATVSSNEIKQSYPKFDKTCDLEFIDNYARIYTLPSGKKLYILGNGASLNLYNGEGAVHYDYQPFLASMIESIGYCANKDSTRGKEGLDTELADYINNRANILGKYLILNNSLLGKK